MKTKISILLLLLIASLSSWAQTEEHTFTLEMTITGLASVEGKVGIQLLNADKEVVEQQNVRVEATTMQARFEGLAEGRYAVQYYHDANDNDEMDFRWFGPPAEGYGNSNNVRATFSAPEFAPQLFNLSSDTTIEMSTVN